MLRELTAEEGIFNDYRERSGPWKWEKEEKGGVWERKKKGLEGEAQVLWECCTLRQVKAIESLKKQEEGFDGSFGKTSGINRK